MREPDTTDAQRCEALLTEMEALSPCPTAIRRFFAGSSIGELEVLLVQMRAGQAAIDRRGSLFAHWDDAGFEVRSRAE